MVHSIIEKQQGAVLMVVLLFCSLTVIIVLFGLESAILQNKMAYNYRLELVEHTKAQSSLDSCQQAFWQYPHIYPSCAAQVDFLQFVPDAQPVVSPSDADALMQGQDFYRIYSSPALKVRLQSTIAIRRTKTGVVKEIKRKTWEEIRD